jgi:hypothetical protein
VRSQQSGADRCAAVDCHIFAFSFTSNTCLCLETCSQTGNLGEQISLFSLVAEDGSDKCKEIGSPPHDTEVAEPSSVPLP